jgi:hypothetical protein
MNLHSIASGAVGAINPLVIATIQQSTGYVDADDGTQVPSYAAPVNVQVQSQPLTFSDLRQLDGLNIQGIKKALYLTGVWRGLVRTAKKGGDLVTMPDGSIWLVVLELENWSDTSGWCKVACTLQNGS